MSKNTRMQLTHVVNDTESGRVFGYAVTDDGDQVYIPGNMVSTNEITTEDAMEGAFIWCVTRDNPRFTKENSSAPPLIAIPPMRWDQEVDVDFNHVTSNIESMLGEAGELIREAIGEFDKIRNRLNTLDEKQE